MPTITPTGKSRAIASLACGLRYAIVLWASLIVLAQPLRAATEEPQVLVGTVGRARVVMELDRSGEEITGRYFYRKYRMDMSFTGTVAKDTLILEARTSGDRMVLRRTQNAIVGTLTTKDGRSVPIHLAPAGPESIITNKALSGKAELSPYERAQLADLALVPGETRREGTGLVREWREPVSGITLFRIEEGYAQPVMNTINAALERQHWEQVSNWFTCEGYDGAPGVDISEERAIFLNDDFISFAWFSSWSCAGAAHPDFGTQGFTFDAQTGRELGLEDVLYFGDLPAPVADSAAFYAYRSEVFAPRIVASLREIYPEEMTQPNGEASEDECDYTDASVWDFPSWYMSKDGLYLGAYFARVQRPCDEPDWSIIPWPRLTWQRPAGSLGNAPSDKDHALHFGELALAKDDIANLSQDFDDHGIPVLDIALLPNAAAKLQSETIRLLNTDVAIALGAKPLVTARLVEPLADGRIRISGRFSVPEISGLADEIICSLLLSPSQYHRPSLLAKLPCKTPL